MPRENYRCYDEYKKLVIQHAEDRERWATINRDHMQQIASLERALDTMHENFQKLLDHKSFPQPDK